MLVTDRARESRCTFRHETGILALTVLAVFLPVVVVSQTDVPATQLGTIAGRVIEGARDRPVDSALVQLAGANVVRRVLTDATGRFAFARVVPGQYRLSAEQFGFLRGEYGKLWPSLAGRAVDLEPGGRLDDLTVRVWKYAAVGGTVRDHYGEPLVGITVRALAVSAASGRRSWSFDTSSCSGEGCLKQRTDDRGQYRFFLVPGEYIFAVPVVAQSFPASIGQGALDVATSVGALGWLGGGVTVDGRGIKLRQSDFVLVDDLRGPPIASIVGNDIHAYQMQFFSMTGTVEHATPLVLDAGDVRTDVDFSLAPTRTSRVEGTVSYEGRRVSGMTVRLIPEAQLSLAQDLETAVSATDQNGRFVFHGVVPGRYKILGVRADTSASSAQPSNTSLRQPQPSFSGELGIGVGEAPVLEVRLDLVRSARMSGRIEFKGARPIPRGGTTSVLIERADSRRDAGIARWVRVDESWRFSTSGHSPGHYYVRMPAIPAGWRLEAITLRGRNVQYEPIEVGSEDLTDLTIVLHDSAPATVTGTVKDARGRSLEAVVVAFPSEPRLWTGSGEYDPRFIQVSTDREGRFSLDVPPGEYYVAALVETRDVLWREHSSLQALIRRAASVTARSGERRAIELRGPERQ